MLWRIASWSIIGIPPPRFASDLATAQRTVFRMVRAAAAGAISVSDFGGNVLQNPRYSTAVTIYRRTNEKKSVPLPPHFLTKKSLESLSGTRVCSSSSSSSNGES